MPIAANKANVGYSQGELTISDDSFMVSDHNLRFIFLLLVVQKK